MRRVETAKVPHRCTCGREIKAGSLCYCIKYTDQQGQWHTIYMCYKFTCWLPVDQIPADMQGSPQLDLPLP